MSPFKTRTNTSRTMLLSFSAAPLRLLSPPPNHRSLIPHQNPNFAPKLIVIRRPCTSRHRPFCHSNRSEHAKLIGEEAEAIDGNPNLEGDRMEVAIGNPSLPLRFGTCRMTLGDQAFFLLAFIACTTSIAFTSLVIAAIPTLLAMKRAATSLAKLADTAQDEIPSTMAAIRLSGMEISDLTLELSDLSQEIADGVSKSAQAVHAAEAGIRQMGDLARSRTLSLIQERANLPNISLQLVVVGAAKKTSSAVSHAKKTFMNMISRGDEYGSDDDEEVF